MFSLFLNNFVFFTCILLKLIGYARQQVLNLFCLLFSINNTYHAIEVFIKIDKNYSSALVLHSK